MWENLEAIIMNLRIFYFFMLILTLCFVLSACGGQSTSNSGGGVSKTPQKMAIAKELLSSRAPEWNFYVDRYIISVGVGPFNGVSENRIFLTEDFIASSSIEFLASVWVHEAKHVEMGHYGCVHAQEQIILPIQQRVFEQVGGKGKIVADHCM